MTIMITGGAGFIGSNFVLDWLAQSEETIVNLDKLTYAGNLQNLAALDTDPRHMFVHGDIGDGPMMDSMLALHKPRAIVNFAAESHALLDELRPRQDGKPYKEQIQFVTDRPGHDRRYAIDARKIESELGWRPGETFATGIRKTVLWYLENHDWVANVQSGTYREWLAKQYGNTQVAA